MRRLNNCVEQLQVENILITIYFCSIQNTYTVYVASSTEHKKVVNKKSKWNQSYPKCSKVRLLLIHKM